MPSTVEVRGTKGNLVLKDNFLKVMFKFTFIINSPDKPMGEVKPYGNEAAFIDHITLQIKQVAELKGIYCE